MKEPQVYVGMSADIIHPGHMNILKISKSYGEVTVGLLTDEAISSYKKIPVMSYEERFEVLSGVKYVDNIIEQKTHDYTENLDKLKPDFVIHGDDWQTGIQKPVRDKVIQSLDKWGGKLIEVPYTEGVSSKQLKASLQKGVTTEQRLKSLRNLLNFKDTIRFLDIHNALSAIVIENAKYEKNGKIIEFDGMWGSSLTDSTSKGKPDIEAVDTTSRLNTLNEILEVTTKPIIYDGDTGGKQEHFIFTVQTLERLGISAVIIEDKKGLKKNSLFGNTVKQEQEDVDVFCEKIIAGNKAKKTDDFMIFARIESLILDKGLTDAHLRAERYAEAGANGILIHSKDSDEKDIISFIKTFKKNSMLPIAIVPTTYNHVHISEFEELGVDIIIYANHLLRSAYPSMLKTAESILKYGRTNEIENDLMSIKEIINFIPSSLDD